MRYFKDQGISPFVTSFPIQNDVDYLSKRYRETHDIFHVLTGYGIDHAGEMELQAFVLGNLRLRQAILILLFGTARRGDNNDRPALSAYLKRLHAAWRRGRASRELLGVPYETLWETPVAELTAKLCPRLA